MMKKSKTILFTGEFKGMIIPKLKALDIYTGDKILDTALKVVFFHEGLKSSNDPDDRGGATYYGISLRFAKSIGDLDGDGFADLDYDHDGDVDIDDLLNNVDIYEAADLYKKHFWDANKYNLLPEDIAIKAFDLSINMGARQANILLQQSVLSVTGNILFLDGIIGKKSRAAIKECNQQSLLAAYRASALCFYLNLVQRDPVLQKYINGWTKRAIF